MSTETKHKTQEDVINAFIYAVSETLSRMTHSEVVLTEKRSKRGPVPGDLSALMMLMGSQGEGVVSLSFGKQLAKTLISRFVGLPESDITEEVCCDGVGELVNMVAGSAKVFLSQIGQETYKLSLPSIVVGDSHDISSRYDGESYMALAFLVEDEPFYLQVSLSAGF